MKTSELITLLEASLSINGDILLVVYHDSEVLQLGWPALVPNVVSQDASKLTRQDALAFYLDSGVRAVCQ